MITKPDLDRAELYRDLSTKLDDAPYFERSYSGDVRVSVANLLREIDLAITDRGVSHVEVLRAVRSLPARE